jgi:hypothetical protein
MQSRYCAAFWYDLGFRAEQGERHCRERPHMDVRAGLVVEARIAKIASVAWIAEMQILQEQHLPHFCGNDGKWG